MGTSPSNQPRCRRSSLRSILSALIPVPSWQSALLPTLVLAVACAWMTAGVGAQGQPTFRAQTEIVRMDVRITDAAGRPVSDVTPEEIQVIENGRPRPVLLFRHLAEPRDDGEGQSAAYQEVSANGAAISGHLYVLVFDQAHIGAGGEHRVQQAAQGFLAHALKPGDAVAIYALPGPGPMMTFTSDLAKARMRIAEVRGKAARRPTTGLSEYDAYQATRTGGQTVDLDFGSSSYSDMSKETAKGTASQVVAAADTETHVFLQNLADIMRGLRPIEGRKSFVIFSEGFLADNLGPQLEQVASAAAQSQSVVYGVDLNRTAGPGAGTEMAERREPLGRLADETNGLLFPSSMSLDEALSKIAAQANDYYLVGFEPAPGDAPHDYHRVKVQVTRHGLVAHTRTGYSTLPAVSSISDRQAIDVALAVPRTSSALPIAYTTYERVGSKPDTARIIASITAHVPRVGGVNRIADVVFVVRDAAGRAVASGSDQVRVQAGQGEVVGALDPLQYSVQFDVPPGDYWMRVLVREPGGVIGTADRRLHVWPLTGPGITTSDLIVTRLDGQRFDAPTEADVSRGDQVLAYMEVYGVATDAVDAKIEVVSNASNEVVATAEPVVKPGVHGERILRARLPIDALAAGFYAARVRLVAPNQALRTVVRNFRIVAERTAHEK